MSSLHQNRCFEIGTLHRHPTEALMSEVKICVTSDKIVAADHKYDHKIHTIVLMIIVMLSDKRKKWLDRTHIVFNIIAREYSGFHHDSLMWTNTKGVRCASDLFTFCPNFVQHNQMFIRQNRPSILSSAHIIKLLSDVRPIHMQCSDEHNGLLSWCASDKEQGGLVFVPLAQMCPGSTEFGS